MRRQWPAELFLVLVAVIMLLPIALIFLTAFKPNDEILRFATLWPKTPTLEHFQEILGNPDEIPIGRWLTNSLLVSSLVTALVVTVDALAAYGLARLNLPGKKYVFGLIIATMMVPGQILLVPMYLILGRLGWLDTLAALIIPAGGNAFGVFLLHQFFKGVPRELEEAAALDGCGLLGIFWNVIVPTSWPALAALAIFTFMGSWNDFLGPLVYLDSVDKYTLPVGIALFQSSYANEYGLTLAASVICTIPVLAVFLLFQRQLVAGISFSGIKD
jgi:multiple sugar transport system permease protein